MGHVRTGFLPHTRQWNVIVQQLSLFGGDASIVPTIANGTLTAIKKTYEIMPFDESVQKAVSFLANLAFSAKQADQIDYLWANGYIVDGNLSIFSLVASAQKLITTENGSLEINKIAKDAAMQAVIAYQDRHQDNQIDLFGNTGQSPLRNIGNGAAFCELARSFFAEFTDRQIKYYVERVGFIEFRHEFVQFRDTAFRLGEPLFAFLNFFLRPQVRHFADTLDKTAFVVPNVPRDALNGFED
jgi:hypothetical protein